MFQKIQNNPQPDVLDLLKKEKFWAHKIGKTEGNPLDRIKKQVGTALPEKAIIPTILKTDNPDELEKVIQCYYSYHWKNTALILEKYSLGGVIIPTFPE